MHILLAPNAFKGSLSAPQVCSILAERLSPAHTIQHKPLADGGDGTLTVLRAALEGFESVTLQVSGPLPSHKVTCEYLWHPQKKEGFIELSLASGLALLPKQQRNPEQTSTYGTGELIADAINRGAQRIRIAIGGSATNDGGTGALAALGFRFLDSAGVELTPCGGSLSLISRIIKPERKFPVFEVLCDVTNPLIGPHGAAYVYGPQKGADEAMVKRLDAGLQQLRGVVKRDFDIEIDLPGAGAAGGFAAGALFGLGARFVSGFDSVASMVELEHSVQKADLIITGEGWVDSQSLQGKVISGVFALARRHARPVIVVAGGSDLHEQTAPIVGTFQLMRPGITVEYAMQNAATLLREQADEIRVFLEQRENSAR